MKKFRNLLISVLGLGLLAATSSMVGSRTEGAQGPPGGLNVNVLNTPLPVTGSLGVSGTVQAQQSGAWSVNVLNSPLPVTGSLGLSGTVQAQQSGAWSVGINNAKTSPVPIRDVENPARQPFAFDSFCALVPGSDVCVVLFSIPAGKRLVIESITVEVSGPTGQKGRADIFTTVAGTSHGFRLSLAPVGTFSGQDIMDGTHPLRLYADPTSTVSLRGFRNSTSGDGAFAGSVSGYLVDCGAGLAHV